MYYIAQLLRENDQYYCFHDDELQYIETYGMIPETLIRLDKSSITEVENCDIFQEELKRPLYNINVPEEKIMKEVINDKTIYNVTEPFAVNSSNNSIKISGLIMCLGVYLVNEINENIVGFHYETAEDDKENTKLKDSMELIESWGDNYKIIIYRLENKKYEEAQIKSIKIIEEFYNKKATVILTENSSIIYPPIKEKSISFKCAKCTEEQYELLGPHPTLSHNRKVREFIKNNDKELVKIMGFS